MKTLIYIVAGIAVIMAALVWSCIKTEVIDPTQIKSSADSTEYILPDTTRLNSTEEDTTGHPISFDVTVTDWEESGDTIYVEL